MANILLVFILLFPVRITAQIVEGSGIFIFDDKTKTIKWLDENGRGIKIFERDYQPKLHEGKLKRLEDSFIHHNYEIHHFEIGLLPVKYKDTWQLYDAIGNKILTLSKPYLDISLAAQGFYILTVQDSVTEDAFVYMDSHGKELFEGRVFSEVSEFRKYIAFAAQGEKWYILNARENTCNPLENEALQPLYEVKRNTELYSVATAGPKGNIQKYLIDTLGQIVYSASMCGGINWDNIASLTDQVIICSQKYKAFFYDMHGQLLLELDDIKGLKARTRDFMLFNMQNGEKRLFDYKMNPVTLHVSSGVQYDYHDISNLLLVANVQDTKTQQKYLGLFDKNSKEQVYRMEEYNFGGTLGHKVIYANLKWIGLEFKALANLDGKILYAEKNKEAIYNVAVADYFLKTDVKGLIVIQDEAIEKLPQYKHIKTIEFEEGEFEELPECLCQFQNLQSITLKNCNKLIRLPNCLGKLPYFNDLLIQDCTNLTELQQFLMSYPKTLVINTEGHYFSEGFDKIIEEKLPHIKLTSWTDNWFLNDLD